MSVDGIQGPGVIPSYEGWLLLSSFSWSGSRGTGKRMDRHGVMGVFVVAPQLKAVSVARSADIVTPLIWQLMLTNTKKTVKFAWLRTGSDGLTPFLEITLTKALITAMGESATLGEPSETITFAYDEVEARVVNVGNRLTGPQDVVSYVLSQGSRI
ncbi:type VI secretion system tube protein Hcp [Roseomonas fluvialis]|nr:type VI secretion system tube protein Hcp [Roseomonas fluvialis]